MIRQRPPSDRCGGRRRRVAPALALLVGASLCALAASALVVPGFVFGVEAAEPAGPVAGETSMTTEAAAMATDAARTTDQGAGEAAPSVISAGQVLVTLPWGDGAGEVGFAKPTEGLVRGPEALAVAPDGRIAVLDSVNKRIVYLGPAGAVAGSAPIPLAEPRYLAVDDERLYVLDCDADRLLITLDWDGAVLSATALPELDDVVTGLFATSRGPSIEIAHDDAFLVHATGRSADTAAGVAATRAVLRPLAGRPLDSDLGRAAKATFAPGRGVRVKSFLIDKNTFAAAQTTEISPALAPGRAVEHLVSVDGDGKGGVIIGARLVDAEPGVPGRAVIALTRPATGAAASSKDAAAGAAAAETGTLLLSDSSAAYVGQPYVVAPDGRVFQPVAGDDGYTILVHTFPQTEEVQP